VQEELPVSLRARQPGVYDADRLRPPFERSVGRRAEDAPVDLPVADDSALPNIGAAGLELRLDEDERLPAWSGEP
jgi:hypothetical protein